LVKNTVAGRNNYNGQPVKAAKKNRGNKKATYFLLSLAATINNVDETERSDFDISIPGFYKQFAVSGCG